MSLNLSNEMTTTLIQNVPFFFDVNFVILSWSFYHLFLHTHHLLFLLCTFLSVHRTTIHFIYSVAGPLQGVINNNSYGTIYHIHGIWSTILREHQSTEWESWRSNKLRHHGWILCFLSIYLYFHLTTYASFCLSV